MNNHQNAIFHQLDNFIHHNIYQLSATQLYGVILRILRQDQLAQDCLQKVFVKAYYDFFIAQSGLLRRDFSTQTTFLLLKIDMI
jgi:hypothetical protein